MDPKEMVSSWLDGRARAEQDGTVSLAASDENQHRAKLRRAYAWMAGRAVRCPYDDMEFGPFLSIREGEFHVSLHTEESYASFLLLPLLTLMTSRRLLLVGAPGRGKTTVATLMSVLSGASLEEARRQVQHGHPQLTISDLLGSPLPSDLVKASSTEDIRVSWRKWIRARVKVIDEYNRIPTKTQSALLSLMAEGYAEMFEQTIETGRSAWFLTANDDLGGGTFPVIEALKDRIDVVVRCTPFHARFLGDLLARVEGKSSPEGAIPDDIVFTEAELDALDLEVRAVPVPEDVQRVLGFFLGQLDFCRRASDRLEYMNKDTLHLAGRKVAHVCNEDCPLDKQENLCTQTEAGVSARSYQALIHYAKALAFFRGAKEVSVEDFRQLAPWVLLEKLRPNTHSAFFQKGDHQVLLMDRVSWIRQLFDKARAQQAAYARVRRPIEELHLESEERAERLSSSELRQRLSLIRRLMEDTLKKSELNGPVYEDLILLKNLHYRCHDRLRRRYHPKA